MGLNLQPSMNLGFPNVASGPQSGLDLNFGGYSSLPIGGPAPAASAAPVVPTAGVMPLPGVGLPTDVVSQNAMAAATGIDPMDAPTADGLGWGDMKFMDKAQVALGGLGTLAKVWSAFQANKIAKDSLDFQKRAFETNLSNQRASYNTALEDRANSRASYAGTPEARATADEYINNNRI